MVNLPILSKTWFLTKNLTSWPTRVWLIVSYGSWLTCLAWYLTPIVVNYNKPQHHHQNIFTRQTSEALTLVVLVYLLSAYVIKFLLLRIWLAIRLLVGRCLVACRVRDRKFMYVIVTEVFASFEAWSNSAACWHSYWIHAQLRFLSSLWKRVLRIKSDVL